jgi:riboflavin transporter FmnP
MDNNKTKHLTTLAMLTAMAYVVGFFIRVRFMPGAPFLTYDPKDVVIVIGGLMFGPLSALITSVVLAFLEMVTHSDSGPLGMIMNAIASATFACPAAYIYRRSRTLKGAILGIAAGIITATSAMLLWNYLIVPLYTGWPRSQVAALILPAFLPFNLIKTSLNGAMVLLVYKPITLALKTARLYNPSHSGSGGGKFNIGLMLASAFVVLSLILLILTLRGGM